MVLELPSLESAGDRHNWRLHAQSLKNSRDAAQTEGFHAGVIFFYFSLLATTHS